MEYSDAYNKALEHAMLYEVGGFFSLTDEVRAGLIKTREQRRACGYVNDPDDAGGETKYGVAKNANPDLNIATLDWAAAKRVYYKRYWLSADCQLLPARLAVLHFDIAVNHGVGRAAKFLQTAVGAVADGDIGPATLKLVAAHNEIEMCNNICNQREKFYRDIVAAKLSQSKYLAGWLRRSKEMRDFTTNPLNTFQ